MRILTLVPEVAEIIADIGGEHEMVAAGGVEALQRALETDPPDVIFTSETAAGGGVPRPDVRRVVARALGRRRPRPAVYALEPRTVGDILSDVKTVGDAIGRPAAARALIEALRVRIDAVSLRAAERVARDGPRRVVCLIGDDLLVAAGWWQAELVGLAGGLDVLDGVGRPPRPTSWGEIVRAEPELVLVFGRSALTPHPPLPQAGEGADSTLIPTLSQREREMCVGVGASVPVWDVAVSGAGPVVVEVLERVAATLSA